MHCQVRVVICYASGVKLHEGEVVPTSFYAL